MGTCDQLESLHLTAHHDLTACGFRKPCEPPGEERDFGGRRPDELAQSSR